MSELGPGRALCETNSEHRPRKQESCGLSFCKTELFLECSVLLSRVGDKSGVYFRLLIIACCCYLIKYLNYPL